MPLIRQTGGSGGGLPGAPGVPGKDGKDGKDGTDGADGATPEIGVNGNWWIDGVDTGKPTVGKDGKDGEGGGAGGEIIAADALAYPIGSMQLMAWTDDIVRTTQGDWVKCVGQSVEPDAYPEANQYFTLSTGIITPKMSSAEQGGYKLTVSGIDSPADGESWRAFDQVAGGNWPNDAWNFIQFTKVEERYAVLDYVAQIPIWISVELPERMALDRYILRTRNHSYSDPKHNYFIPTSWVLEGSDDGVSWDLVDERENEIFTVAAYSPREFVLDATVVYKHYRFTFSEIMHEGNGGTGTGELSATVSVGEIELYGNNFKIPNVAPVNGLYTYMKVANSAEPKEKTWCSGYFEDRSLTLNTELILTPVFQSGKDMVDGNRFVAPVAGWYELIVSGGLLSVNNDTMVVIVKNIDVPVLTMPDASYIVAENKANNSPHIPVVIAKEWLEEGEYLTYYAKCLTATSNTINQSGAIHRFRFSMSDDVIVVCKGEEPATAKEPLICSGIFEDKGLAVNTATLLTPLIEHGMNMVDGNKFVAPEAGWYELSVSGGYFGNSCDSNVFVIKNKDSATLVSGNYSEMIALNKIPGSNVIPVVAGREWLEAGEWFAYYCTSNAAQSTICASGTTLKFVFSKTPTPNEIVIGNKPVPLIRCTGYFQNTNLPNNAWKKLTPVYETGDDILDGNKFVAPRDAWYELSIVGGGLPIGSNTAAVVVKNEDSADLVGYDQSKMAGASSYTSMSSIPPVIAKAELKKGENLSYYVKCLTSAQTGIYNNGSIPRFIFRELPEYR